MDIIQDIGLDEMPKIDITLCFLISVNTISIKQYFKSLNTHNGSYKLLEKYFIYHK